MRKTVATVKSVFISFGGDAMKESASATIITSGAIILFLCMAVFSQEAVQIQSSSDGKMEASLIRAKVRGDVLSVKIALKNTTTEAIEPEIPFKECYVTDIKAVKKYFPLKDPQGDFLAGPQPGDGPGGIFRDTIKGGESRIIWVNFPVPPEPTDTVDLFVPGMLPFEEVKISRSPDKG